MKIAIGLCVVALFGAPAFGAPDHAMSGTSAGAGQPSLHETGQSAFAAIAEATRALEADPSTDWANANLDALRQHLVDMDNVTLRSVVATKPVRDGVRFEVTSDDSRVRELIDRMAHMHAGMASQESPYRIFVQNLPNGVVMTVTGSTAADAAKIRGLGFFGLLTEGDHHQRHHLALAKGREMHH